jgi:NAD(P)-dependent dehydrogenase (short-subunit alcohol dehydrogenase family)
MTGRLDNRVAFVTGAASGIGAASARLFAQEGAWVIAADISEKVLSEYEGAERINGIVLDVADSSAVNDAFRIVAGEFGRLDILLNGAGIAGLAPDQDEQRPTLNLGADPTDLISMTTDKAFARVLAVNLFGPFYTLRAAVPLLKAAGGGSVINISSVAALIGAAMPPPYPASKAGVLGLTRAAATELAPHNIRVNAVAPGAVDTPMLHLAPPEVVAQLINMQPIKRAAPADEIAQTMLFLASDAGAYYTGQVFSPSGGLHM